jgi:uncharacterized damage-inducible protein DinB
MKLDRRSCFPLLAAPAAAALAQEAAPKAPAPRAAFLADLEGLQKKYVSLAEAIPEEKYDWRPAPGVRSIGEVLLHVATANFMLGRMVGLTPPEGIDPKMEKTVTGKAKIVPLVRDSFQHFHSGVAKMPEADMAKEVKVFGRAASTAGALVFLGSHLHEHLGQLIAYARVQGIAPPWSRGREG